jgi:tetratricopeptide (TPR) repeat protein
MSLLKKIFGIKPSIKNIQRKPDNIQLNDTSEHRFSKQVGLNTSGKENEKNGEVEIAIKKYEKNISEGFVGNHPYDRLAVIYRKTKDYDNELRVLNRAIEVFNGLSKTSP